MRKVKPGSDMGYKSVSEIKASGVLMRRRLFILKAEGNQNLNEDTLLYSGLYSALLYLS